MPEIPDVIPGEIIDPDTWGNPIRDRTVQRYNSVEARDAEHPAPAAGDLAVIQSGLANSFFQIFKTGIWNAVALLTGAVFTGAIQVGDGTSGTSVPFSVHRNISGNNQALETVISSAAGTPGAGLLRQLQNGVERTTLAIDGANDTIQVQGGTLHVDSDSTIAEVKITRRAIGRWWRWVIASNGDLLAQYSGNGTDWTTALTIPDSPE